VIKIRWAYIEAVFDNLCEPSLTLTWLYDMVAIMEIDLDPRTGLMTDDTTDPFHPNNLPVREEFNLDEAILSAPQPARNPGGQPLTAEEQKNPPPLKWEVDVLRPRHREILRRVLEGATYIEIADQMGIHRQTVMLIATSPMFQAELAKLEQQRDYAVIQRADSMAHEALDTIKVAMRSARSEFLRVKSAKDMLDIAGYSKIERKIVGIVTGEDVIRELNKKRREMMMKPEQASYVTEGEAKDEC
jgi:hypothetical protein